MKKDKFFKVFYFKFLVDLIFLKNLLSSSYEKIDDINYREVYGDILPLKVVLHIDSDNGRILVQDLELNKYFVLAEGTTLFTGSIHKLQRAMGHSSLNVSLTYLRGLEVAELKEKDMPMVYHSLISLNR